MNTIDKPNIIIILPDQLRRQALSCYGDVNVATPNIDSLSAGGVTFTNACSTYPVCVPFRYTLITGRPAHQDNVPSIHYRLSPQERTLADEFNDAEYETVYCGKWHLYGKNERIPSEYRGRWKHWYGYDVNADHFRVKYYVNDEQTPRFIEDTFETDAVFDLGMKHLRERTDPSKPFCMVLSPTPPHDHAPTEKFYEKYPVHERYPNKFFYRAPEELQSKWENRDIHLPPNFQPEDEQEREYFLQAQRGYYASVENLDCNVARLGKFLAEQSLDKNTIIVFFSDHGDLIGSHAGGMHKQSPYAESIGIPLIVYDPRCPNLSGRKIDEPVHTEDLYPTILGLAGIQTQRNLVGENLAPIIRGEVDTLNRPGVMLEYVRETRRVFSNFGKSWRGFRSKQYKYTVLSIAEQPAEPWQFFDLDNDPYELDNRIDDPNLQDIIAEHHAWLADELVRSEDAFKMKEGK